MGLFSNLFNSGKAARPCVSNIRPWNVPNPQFEAIPAADNMVTVYIYDPRPLSGVYVGQEIIVEAFAGAATLTSSITGFQTECGTDFDIALMYNGQIFGSAKVEPKKIFEAAQRGYAIKFRAVADGVLPEYGNILDLKMYCPNKLYLYGLIPGIEDDRPMQMRENAVTYNIYKEKEFTPLATRDSWNLSNLRIEYLPVKEGSKAKPHIGVYLEDGQIITDAVVQRGCYQDLAYMIENYTSFNATANRYTNDDGSVIYRITIVGR